MDVELYQIELVVKAKRTRLTKAVARQIPFDTEFTRWDKAHEGQPGGEPLGKVLLSTLHHPQLDGPSFGKAWAYLVRQADGTLLWARPVTFTPKLEKEILEQGGWVDDPDSVPLVIL